MRIVICDDSSKERELYSSSLRELAKKHAVNLELNLYENATSLIFDAQDADFSADLIFMDIHMPGITGDEASGKLREFGYQNDIVFLTVSKEHFRTAFDVNALHYVVKGETKPDEFEKIFLRAIKSMEEKDRNYVMYSGGGESRNIALSSIKYYEIYKKIVTVYYDDTSFQFPSSLEKLENELSEYGFYRIHKSFLVFLSAIESITAKEVTLRGGAKLPISRNCYSDLKATLSTIKIK